MSDLEKQIGNLIKAADLEKGDLKDLLRNVASNTINPQFGKPEIATLRIVPVDDILGGNIRLLHTDQISLFQKIDQEIRTRDPKHHSPTLSIK